MYSPANGVPEATCKQQQVVGENEAVLHRSMDGDNIALSARACLHPTLSANIPLHMHIEAGI